MPTPALVDLVCAVFDDTYGQVGARILRALLSDGQLSIPELVRKTKLTPTAVQRSLVSMVTNRFVLFWHQGSKTLYYGNWKQVYRILWSGQLLAQSEGELSDLEALKQCLLQGLVKDSPANRPLISEKFIIPVREWQFWPNEELVQSVYSKKTREIASNPESMGKSENAQKIQVTSESQAELERMHRMVFVNTPQNESDLLYTVNWEKFLIQSRRHEFVQFVARQIGATTAKVYEIVLRLSEHHVHSVTERRIPSSDLAVTTQQIVGQLDKELVSEMAAVFEAGASKNGSGEEPSGKKLKSNSGEGVNVHNIKPAELVNKHLDLLMESRTAPFVQKMGNRQGGEWFVPFDRVNEELKQNIFDEIVSQSLGEPASRLIGLIRQRGKLDEKMLGNFALLPTSEIRHQMSALSCYGFADIQELAKPNERGGSGGAAGAAQKRSMFLWYHRPDWAYTRLLDLVYGQITATLKQSQDLRREHRILLTKLSRDDVKSDINQFLTAKELEELNEFKETERGIFKQMNMLDRNVRIFREY